MKLQNLISKLEKHHKKKIDLTLNRTFNLLKKLGNPQNKLKNVINLIELFNFFFMNMKIK